MQVKKQQLELDMEQQTVSKLGKESFKAVYCHFVYLIYMHDVNLYTYMDVYIYIYIHTHTFVYTYI